MGLVFLTMHSNGAIFKEASELGASGYIVKSCPADDLVYAVKTVLNGGTYVSPEVQTKHDSSAFESLSERQVDVLRLIAQGCGSKQIGFKLGISSRTAEFHKNAIIEKLNLYTIAQLTRYAIEHGLVS